MRPSSQSPSMRSIQGGTTMSRSTTPEGTQRNFPTRTEWESWKDTIRELYIERNMTLARLRDHMAQVYGFHAEDHEYKRRLAQWRFRKNYTSAEKEAVAMHLDNFRAQQQPVAESEFRLNNRPLRMDKIERHRKAARRKSNKTVALQLNSDPSPEPEFALSTFASESDPDVEEHLNRQLSSAPVPQYTFPMAHNEAMLWNVNQYDQNRQQDDMLGAPASIEHQDRMFVVMFNIVKAVHNFGAGNSQIAVQILDECCDSVKDLLQTDTWNFMMYMTVLQTLPAWNRGHSRDLYHYLYSFFARMSFQVLGQPHPVTDYLRLAADFDSRQKALFRACLLVIELGAQQFAMAQTKVKYSGGIPLDTEGGLDYRFLGSERLETSSSRMQGGHQQQQRPALDANLDEMVRLLGEGWYSQDLENAAEVMSKLKKSIEGYVRRLVGHLNTSTRARMNEEDVWRSRSASVATMDDQNYLDSTAVRAAPDPSTMMMMSTTMDHSRSRNTTPVSSMSNYPPNSRTMMGTNPPRRR